MKAWIKGIGWLTAAGSGRGRQASRQPFCAGELDIPGRKQVFDKPDMRFGRLDAFSRIGLAALAFCLRDADRETWTEKRPIGIVAASRYGCLQTDLDYLQTMLPDQGKLASPNLFAYTLPNCFLGEAALRFGLTGSSLVLNQEDPGGLAPLRYALDELAWSGLQGMLAGVCDLDADRFGGGRFPGALFLLLDKDAGAEAYGVLETSGEQVLFDAVEMTSLEALVSACLAAGNH